MANKENNKRSRNLATGFLDIASKILKWCCVAIAALLVLFVGIQVFARYVLRHPTSWSEAVMQIMFIWLTLFGAAVVVREKSSLYVDLVQSKLKGTALFICRLACDVIGMITTGAFVYSSFMQIGNTMNIMEGGLPFPRGGTYIGILIGFLFLLLFEIEDFVRAIVERVNGSKDNSVSFNDGNLAEGGEE